MKIETSGQDRDEIIRALRECITDDRDETLNNGQRKRRLKTIDSIIRDILAKIEP